MDLNYARDTTSGAEGLAPHLGSARHAAPPAAHRHDRLGQRRDGRGGDAPRRARLHPEAVEQRGARAGAPRRDRLRRAPASQSPRATGARRRPSTARSCRRCCPMCPAASWRGAGSPPRGSAATTTTRCSSAPIGWRICIADVCGKGLPAALLVSSLQATVRAFVGPETPRRTRPSRASTARCAGRARTAGSSRCSSPCSTCARATIRFCNAGHNRPMLVRADGAVSRLDTGGAVVGVFDTAAYDRRPRRAGRRRSAAALHRRPGRSRVVGVARVRRRPARRHAGPPPGARSRTRSLDGVFGDVHQWAGRGSTTTPPPWRRLRRVPGRA